MYNRYVQNPDGSFKKITLMEPSEPAQMPEREEPFIPCQSPPSGCSNQGGTGILSFFKNLIPGGLDTEDLIVILLLLLLSENHEKGGNQALLTLGAYLFL